MYMNADFDQFNNHSLHPQIHYLFSFVL